jgi:hypothetical protein
VAQRALLVGLPRSGTTWLANVIAAHPDVHLVHEPDNRDLDVLGWLGTGHIGQLPSPRVGASAPDYELMWRLSFSGGWPRRGAMVRIIRPLRSWGSSPRSAALGRTTALRAAARVGATQRPPAPVVLVKSVAAQLAVDWIAAALDPKLLVVWRHPLNLLPSWLRLGWVGAELAASRPAVRERFESTSVWPPPEEPVRSTAWAICAQLTLLLEAAERQPRALVLHHERTVLDPHRAVRRAIEHLGLEWDGAVGTRLDDTDRPGEGWVPNRVAAEEAGRWRTRLASGDVATVLDVAERFQGESGVAAVAWTSSPALLP